MFNKINLRVLRADLKRDPSFVLKMDPYCIIRTSRAETRTSVAPSGGKHPIWNEVFSLDVTGDNSIYLALYDQEIIGKDHAIAEAFVNLSQLQGLDGVSALTFPLTYKGHSAGQIFVEFSFSGSNKNIGGVATPLPLTNHGYVKASVHPLPMTNISYLNSDASHAPINNHPQVDYNASLPVPLVHPLSNDKADSPGYAERPTTTEERLDIANQKLNDNLKQKYKQAEAKTGNNLDPNPGVNGGTLVGFTSPMPPASKNITYQRDATSLLGIQVNPVGVPQPTTGQKIKSGLNDLGNKIETKYEETKAKMAEKLGRSRTPSLERDRRNLARDSNTDVNVNTNVDHPNQPGYIRDPVAQSGFVPASTNPAMKPAPITIIDNRMDRSKERIGHQVRAVGTDIEDKLQQGASDLGRDMANLPSNISNQVNQSASQAQDGVQNLLKVDNRDRSREKQEKGNMYLVNDQQPGRLQQATEVDPLSPEFMSSPAYRQLHGKLIVKIVRAEINRKINLIAKMDPYCMIRTKTAELRTHVAEKADKSPYWNAVFDIELRGDSSIYLGVWDRETISSDDIIADVTVDLRGNLKGDSRYSGWQTLYFKGVNAGRLFIELEYYPSGTGSNLPVAAGPNNTYVNVNKDEFNNMPTPIKN